MTSATGFAIVGVITSVSGLSFALWQVFGGRAARQQILNALPNPVFHPIPSTDASMAGEADYVMENSLAGDDLSKRLAAPKKAVHKALRKLIDEKRVSVYIQEGMTTMDGRQEIALIPYFFKGGIAPSLRPSPEKLQAIIDTL